MELCIFPAQGLACQNKVLLTTEIENENWASNYTKKSASQSLFYLPFNLAHNISDQRFRRKCENPSKDIKSDE